LIRQFIEIIQQYNNILYYNLLLMIKQILIKILDFHLHENVALPVYLTNDLYLYSLNQRGLIPLLDLLAHTNNKSKVLLSRFNNNCSAKKINFTYITLLSGWIGYLFYKEGESYTKYFT
jgi:hypothetical protein